MTEHVKMPDIVPLVRYLADGARTEFAFDFPIFATEDIAVFVGGARIYSGFTVSGENRTEGGKVIFTTAPAAGLSVMIRRDLKLERLTDFIEGGDFSARAINGELDYLTAALQQVARAQDGMLRYDDAEAPAAPVLPPKQARAGKALGFDGLGNPIAVALDGAATPGSILAPGIGATARSVADKAGDIVSIRDFGAVGDGLADDTLAIRHALASHAMVLVPRGIFLITGTITLQARQSLFGLGQQSVIRCASNSFTAIEIPTQQTVIQNLRIEGGKIGLSYFGRDAECTQNAVCDLQIVDAGTGILLDGYTNPDRPCYWNNFSRVLIDRPTLHGVHLTRSGAGDTPNANRFDKLRVYSHGAPTSGCGIWVEHGAFNNGFTDCEANVNGATAKACFRVGAGSNKTLIVNLLTESTNGVPNVQLDAGSEETVIVNLTSTSDGAAIWDLSGGNYDAVNAGYPYKNTLRRSSISDLKARLMRFDTEYIDSAGAVTLDLSHSMHIVDASNGPIPVLQQSGRRSGGRAGR